MRRYDEPIQVHTRPVGGGEDPAHDGEPVASAPHRFLWHGRVYDVETVLDQWVLRLPWWRRALAPDGGAWALAPDLLDERVWRVSAVSRGSKRSGPGVYDLSLGRQWRLLRVGD